MNDTDRVEAVGWGLLGAGIGEQQIFESTQGEGGGGIGGVGKRGISMTFEE